MSTFCSNRYYLRMFCWILDKVIHACFAIVCYLAVAGLAKPAWKKYLCNVNGRHDFQIDMGLALMNRGIEYDWPEGKPRPKWIRKRDVVPYDCKKCYFCLHGMTNGITHKDGSRDREVVYANGVRVKTKNCTDVQVNLFKSSQYCKMCYRKQDESICSGIRKKNCKFSKLGCPSCQESICKWCWAEGYDLHAD